MLVTICVLAGTCGGSSSSSPSQPSPAPANCTYSLSQSTVSYLTQGGAGSVRLTTASTCAWTAASADSWITITSAASGTGSADVAYRVGNNLSLINRTGKLTVGGQTLTITQAGPAMAGCTDSINADAFGGLQFITFLDPISYGCRIVSAADGHPVHDGSESARFELHANECNSAPDFPDCQTDRSRYEVSENNRGESTDGRIVTYEVWVYVPVQLRLRPRGTNILFLNQINFLRLNDEGGTRGIDQGTLAYLEVGESGELMIRTHSDFNDTIQARYTVLNNPVGVWTKILWEVKGSSQPDGYLRVYVNEVLRVDETKRTLPSPGQRHSLRIGIYNAFRSGAREPYDTQVVYFDGIRKSIQ